MDKEGQDREFINTDRQVAETDELTSYLQGS
jgi:hypothetical protein